MYFLYDWWVWSPGCSRDSQESSPAPQLESINSSDLPFFMLQISHSYVTTGETKALTIWTFVSKGMSLLFNMLPRFVIAFLQRIRHILISWLKSPSTDILEHKKLKSVILFIILWQNIITCCVGKLLMTIPYMDILYKIVYSSKIMY